MKSLILKIVTLTAPLLLTSCGGLGPFRQNSSALAGGGAVAGIAVKATVDKVKDIASFDPYLQIETLEICYKSGEREGFFRCILTICKENNADNCIRYIPENDAMQAVDSLEAVVINTKGWARFISAVEVKCKEDPKGCRKIYEDYNEIDKVFIIE